MPDGDITQILLAAQRGDSEAMGWVPPLAFIAFLRFEFVRFEFGSERFGVG